jgi:hypothetical protein
MPKVIYANLVWFLIVMVGTVGASINRHTSEFWAAMPDVRRNYDLFFVGAYGLLFLVALIGILKRKKWGYEFTMAFNYILALLAFIPVVGLIIFNLRNGIPLSWIADLDWRINSDNIIVSSVSIVFIVFMRRPNVKSLFNKSM